MIDRDAEQFEQYRPLMFSIAYRMLGSATDAEDIEQDAYLRYAATPAGQIASPNAFLATIVTRLCLDQLKSAQAAQDILPVEQTGRPFAHLHACLIERLRPRSG